MRYNDGHSSSGHGLTVNLVDFGPGLEPWRDGAVLDSVYVSVIQSHLV